MSEDLKDRFLDALAPYVKLIKYMNENAQFKELSIAENIALTDIQRGILKLMELMQLEERKETK